MASKWTTLKDKVGDDLLPATGSSVVMVKSDVTENPVTTTYDKNLDNILGDSSMLGIDWIYDNTLPTGTTELSITKAIDYVHDEIPKFVMDEKNRENGNVVVNGVNSHKVTGNNNTAMGYSNTVGGTNNVGIGSSNETLGLNSFVGGISNSVTPNGNNSVTLGEKNENGGNYTIVGGHENIMTNKDYNPDVPDGTNGTNLRMGGVVFGNRNTVNNGRNVVGGALNFANSANSAIIGYYDTIHSGGGCAVFGEQNQLTTRNSHFIAGYANTVDYSPAVVNDETKIDGGATFGRYNYVTSRSGFVSGTQNTVQAENSSCIGYKLNTGVCDSCLVIGQYNKAPTGNSWAFLIGGGTSDNPQNVFGITKSGVVYSHAGTPGTHCNGAFISGSFA